MRSCQAHNFTGTVRIGIQIFIDIFGAQRIAALTADREFIGKAWIDYLIHNNIPFFIRIKENRLVEWGEEMRHIAVFFQCLNIGQKSHIQFNLYGHSMFIAGTRSKKGELVIVMSNQDVGLKILEIYKKRWTIELLFANCKKNGFNLEDTHMVELERIEKLFAVVCSALLLCYMVGSGEEKKSPTPFKKTVKTPAFSTFRRGFDCLRKLLIQTRDLALKLILSLLDPPRKIRGSEIRCFENFNVNENHCYKIYYY
ncbi:MAG: transposase [Alphaproteobacteria bacterium]|nr:transposase [Alphaproteobacteria bacterium]